MGEKRREKHDLLLLLSLLGSPPRGLLLTVRLARSLLLHRRHAHPLLRGLLLFPLLGGHASSTHVALAHATQAAQVLAVHAVRVLVQQPLRLLDAVAVQLRTLVVVCMVLALRHLPRLETRNKTKTEKKVTRIKKKSICLFHLLCPFVSLSLCLSAKVDS